MLKIKSFVFSPIQENTYILYNEANECAIIDPGCYFDNEKEQIAAFVEKMKLKPLFLLNTHCHLDHVFGNRWASERWKLPLEAHRLEEKVLASFEKVCQMYGIPFGEAQPMPVNFIEAGETLTFGNTKLKVLLTPGHSPASISFYCEEEKFVLSGDVLFFESIGRTDLPGGNFDTLIKSIRTQIFTLPDETVVLSGHGPATTVRHEKEYNPFL